MRPRFSDETKLLAKAKHSVSAGYTQVRQWWSNKYRLPPNHELFENQSLAELTYEMFEDMISRRDEILEEIKTAESSQLLALEKQLNALNEMLGEDRFIADPLIDKWDRELEAGLVPDLNER